MTTGLSVHRQHQYINLSVCFMKEKVMKTQNQNVVVINNITTIIKFENSRTATRLLAINWLLISSFTHAKSHLNDDQRKIMTNLEIQMAECNHFEKLVYCHYW